MNRLKDLLLIFLLLTSIDAYSVSFDIGVTGAKAGSSQNLGYGFNLDLIFGKRGAQVVLGTTKILQKNKNNDLYQSTEVIDLNLRLSNLSIGIFYGGVVFNVEDFLSSWNFNQINYQYGPSIELFFRISDNWNFGIESRYHLWIDSEGKDNYLSYWVNLNYIINI